MAAEMKSFIDANPANRILLPHHHEDHSGNAAMLVRTFGSKIPIHPNTIQKMQHIQPILPYQHLVWGQAGKAPVSSIPDVVETARN